MATLEEKVDLLTVKTDLLLSNVSVLTKMIEDVLSSRGPGDVATQMKQNMEKIRMNTLNHPAIKGNAMAEGMVNSAFSAMDEVSE